MSPADKIVLAENMKALEAEDELRAGCPDNRVYDLVLAATGSEERASAALAERIADVQRRGGTADI